MFEITYNDADALERYEEEKRAYPGAKYDFTFEKRFLVYHADMLHQIIYYAIDMKTGLSSEVMRRKSGSPVKKAEYASVLMDRLMDSIKYVGDRRIYLSEGVAPLHMIDNIFRVILPHYGFAVREEQIELAKTMFKGFVGKAVSICEAEVGTGKTMAYLVAALVARDYKKCKYNVFSPITISTSSIELQKMIVEKEIPRLSKILVESNAIAKPLTVTLRKGKEHYFCKRRFYDFYDKIKLYPEKYSRLVEAFDACRFADRAFDLDTVKMRESVKSSICVQGCSRCRYEDECFYRRMTERNRFGQFDFQVTNHQLFLTSARMRYEEQHPLLIDSDLVIIDEAHKLHDAALDAMGDQLAENEIKRYVSAVGHLNSNPKKIEPYKAILTGLLSNSEKLFGSAKQKAGYDDTDTGRSQMIELNPEDITLIEALIADIRHIERMRKEEPRHLKNRAGLLIKKLSSFKNQSGNNIWIETDENRLHSICSASKNIGRVLREYVWETSSSFVLTSGTMSDGVDFSFFEKENGIHQIAKIFRQTSMTASPFDYKNHTRLYMPKGIPLPENNSPEYIAAISDEIVKIVKATNGHTAILFTSYKVLEAVYRQTKDRLMQYELIRMTRSNKSAIADFKKSKNGVLFASGSMWEGVDCIGDCLSSVIIPRLPFPMRSATMESKKEECNGLGEFVNTICVPEMLIKLRQGLGRLVRCETDTGLISILDTRATTGKYTDKVGNVLAKYTKAETLDEVEAFFREVKSPAYFEV